MIRIHRPAKAPGTLSSRGQPETALLCAQYDANSAAYDSGAIKFPTANGRIYGAIPVRRQLKACQNNKCCYSEIKFVRDSVHVEHFRPKGALGQKGRKPKQYPGYYWLAYEWSNLMLCKPGINSDKKDYFPLEKKSPRVRNHHGNITLERPMIIDPASEDPRDHIRFHNEEPRGITDRGKYSVKLLLRHPELDEARRNLFQVLSVLPDALKAFEANGDVENASKTRKVLEDAVKPTAQFSSMAIDLLCR